MDYSKDRKKYWRTEIKHRGVLALGGECAICHQKFEDCCYDFHHLNPSEKEFEISASNMNGAKSWLKIRDELLKCALLCSNCHRLFHNGYVELPVKNYFNLSYYDWDLCDAKQVSSVTGEPLDANYTCPTCGGKKSAAAKQCINCSTKEQKCFEVSRETLKEMIYTMSFTEIGKYFGVSDNAIRKRCKSFNLPTKKSEIKTYSEEEWKQV